jgi:hypothetical protein
MGVMSPLELLRPLVGPICDRCVSPTRMVGQETWVVGHADLCTYQCDDCGELQTRVVVRPVGKPADDQ